MSHKVPFSRRFHVIWQHRIFLMLNESSSNKERAIEKLIADSGIDLPQAYLDFLKNRNNYVLEVEELRFELYPAKVVIEINQELCVDEFLSGFFVFGTDGGNEMLAFDVREQQPWKVYMVPMIVMSEDDAKVIADSFESLVQSEKTF